MNRLQYIVVHCLLTPKGRWITKGEIEMWHLGPLDLPGGRVRFKGKVYDSRDKLPLVKINGAWIKKLHGRGWNDRLGYADMVHHNGEIENLTPYNKDAFVDNDEMTWGAVGINSISRHVALEGGIHPASGKLNGIWRFEELYSDEQFVMLAGYVKQAILDYTDIKIIGHNQVPGANKTCPNFDVLQFCHNIGVKAKNIGLLT